MSNEWVGIVNSTAPKYLKGAENLTMRNRLILRLLQKKGRIKLNMNSHTCFWDVEFAQSAILSRADAGLLNFQRHDRLRQLSIDWRGYYGSDKMTRKEMYMNKGDVAIVKRYDRIMPALTQDLRDHFGGEMFIDGYAVGNDNRLHGMESFMGYDNNTVAADRVANPDDNYGGLSTALGNQGGSWSANLGTPPNATAATDWPDGQGDSKYDYLSPKILNYTSSNWVDASNDAWEDTAEKCLTQIQIWLTHGGGQEGAPDLALLSSDLFYGYKNAIESMRRIVVPHKESNDLGFGNVLNHEGMAIQSDFDCPSGTGYVTNLDKMELCSLAPQLFFNQGPTYDPSTDCWLFLAGFFGNVRYRPKHFGKLAAIAT